MFIDKVTLCIFVLPAENSHCKPHNAEKRGVLFQLLKEIASKDKHLKALTSLKLLKVRKNTNTPQVSLTRVVFA